MKIQKKYIETLYKVISGYKTPKMALGRIRDGFLRTLAPFVDQYGKDKQEIYEKFCIKKEDGTPDIKDDKYHFEKEKLTEINEEIDEKIFNFFLKSRPVNFGGLTSKHLFEI